MVSHPFALWFNQLTQKNFDGMICEPNGSHATQGSFNTGTNTRQTLSLTVRFSRIKNSCQHTREVRLYFQLKSADFAT